MRPTLRMFAAIKPGRYLEAGTPTGLTGLLTHATPRSTLLYLYSSTLQKLSAMPETSLYRQSTEALTTHRANIVKSVVPEGWAEWQAKASQIMKEHPEVFTTPAGGVAHDGGKFIKEVVAGQEFVLAKREKVLDELEDEWDGEKDEGPELEGTRSTKDREGQDVLAKERPGSDVKTVVLEDEPALTVEQIEEIENRIGAGLIEEVIQVAEGELKLVEVMLKSKAWEDLEDKPVEGQWTYFNRGAGAAST